MLYLQYTFSSAIL